MSDTRLSGLGDLFFNCSRRSTKSPETELMNSPAIKRHCTHLEQLQDGALSREHCGLISAHVDLFLVLYNPKYE